MKRTGVQDFEHYYKDLFGRRWEDLKQAFEQEPCYIRLQKGLRKPYFIDEASLAAAEALQVVSGDEVLDMCAAPGGKTLALSGYLGPEGVLVANDRSRTRRIRLKKVLDECLTESIRKKIRITGHNALTWCIREKNVFDKVLLDAPCSAERHVLGSLRHLQQWSPSRIRRLAQQQYAMLVSALELVRPGGYITYSTCALTEDENDGVIDRLFKKRKGRFQIMPCETSWGEETAYGRYILPDVCEGRGPMYICRLRRLA